MPGRPSSGPSLGYASQLALITREYGPVTRHLEIQIAPGAEFGEHMHETDTVIYYPEPTYDGYRGYRFIPKGVWHGVPVNPTNETRISVYFELADG